MTVPIRRRPEGSRSRLTPSGSRPKFISYHASRQQYESSRPIARQSPSSTAIGNKSRRLRPDTIFYSVIFMLLTACALYSLSLSTHPRFTMTNPQGVPLLRSSKQYQSELDKLFSQSLLYQNKLTIDTGSLKQQFKERFPEVDTIDVMLPFFGRRALVEATTSRPQLRLQTNSGTYLVDAKGRAIMTIEDLAPNAQNIALPNVKDRADLQVKAGKAVLAAQDVAFITTIYQQFESKNISISSIELPPMASELHVRVANRPYYIKFSLLTDPRVVVGQYFALMKELDSQGVTPGEYIDSRIEEKIYYR